MQKQRRLAQNRLFRVRSSVRISNTAYTSTSACYLETHILAIRVQAWLSQGNASCYLPVCSLQSTVCLVVDVLDDGT